MGGLDEEEKNKEDVEAYKKNEEEWLLQTPLDDELGEYFFISLTWHRYFSVTVECEAASNVGHLYWIERN